MRPARRIAHLIPCDGPGGAERIVAAMATTLQELGHQNVVFLPEHGEGWLAAQLDGTGVTVEHFTINRPFSPASAQLIADAFRRHRIDIAHSHEFSMAVYGAWASWKAGIPHVITMHGGTYWADRMRRRLAMRAAIALSGRTAAVSSDLRRAMIRALHLRPTQIRVVTNGVQYEPPAAVTLREELQLEEGETLLVAVGNLYPVKGHQHLIDAVALLSATHPRVHVAISGRGALADDLFARARVRGIESRVHLLGLRSDVPAVLAAADVFVLPSLSEGLPLALLEAMFAGRPIVASDVGEVRRVLSDGESGVLVRAGDPVGLATALARLLDDPTEARVLGARACKSARARHHVSHMVGRYVGIYEGLLRRQQTRMTSRRRVTAAAGAALAR